MAITSIDIDKDLLDQARSLTGATSNKDAVNLALRRLVAAKRKSEMVESIAELSTLPGELGAPTRSYHPTGSGE